MKKMFEIAGLIYMKTTSMVGKGTSVVFFPRKQFFCALLWGRDPICLKIVFFFSGELIIN